MTKNNTRVPRSVHFADFFVIFAGLFHNLFGAIHAFTEELMEIAVYNANRNSDINKVWAEFSNDLETIEEESDGR